MKSINLAKTLLPVGLLFLGLVAAAIMIATRPEAKQLPPQVYHPIVKALVAEPTTYRHVVESQGFIEPQATVRLSAEVEGMVTAIDQSLKTGGIFSSGSTLVTLDSRDFQHRLDQAMAQWQRAKVGLTLERAEQVIAQEEWESLETGKAPDLAIRLPQLRHAESSLAAAEANYENAKLNLERTQVKAPFEGKVLKRLVYPGQFVRRGDPIAEVFPSAVLEVVTPVPLEDLEYLSIPFDFNSLRSEVPAPKVKLTGSIAGKEVVFHGKIDRLESTIDTATRMARIVVSITARDNSATPIPAGLFVRAEIQGKEEPNVFIIPRTAFQEGNRLLIINEDQRLEIRQVKVSRTTPKTALVSQGIERGERIAISPLESPLDGMRVQLETSENGGRIE